MKSTQRILITIAVSMMVFTGNSCKKFVQIEPPKTQAEVSRIFEDDATATSAAVGVYSSILVTNLNLCNGGATLYPGLSADEFTNLVSNTTYEGFRNNSLLANDATVATTFWTTPYKIIYHINAVLDGLANSNAISTIVRNQLRGEMLYARALHYFYLMNLLGDIPLITGTDFEINAVLSRTSTTKIYAQIIVDLIEARQLLKLNAAVPLNTRPSYYAATGLLARVYLFTKDWANSELMANDILGSGKFGLEGLANAFLPTSKETIFQLPKQNGNVSEALSFIPTSSTVRPTFGITTSLLSAFEAGDNRKANWLKSNTISGTTYYYPFKYKVRASTPVTEYFVVQRLAELYLIRAESRANQNKLSDSIDDVDMVRSRAGLLKIKDTNPGISKESLLTAILKERQTELFAEWGHRWLDLKRTGKADEILAPIKGANWQSTDKLYPIPFAQIQLNPSLTQNDGYTN